MSHDSHLPLIVEDDADIREALQDVMASEGWPAETAGDGLAAKEKLEAGFRPCVIVLDLMMPRMSGDQFLAWLRAQVAELARIPVVVLTAASTLPPLDAQKIIRKPVPLEVLLREIETYCGGCTAG